MYIRYKCVYEHLNIRVVSGALMTSPYCHVANNVLQCTSRSPSLHCERC